MARKPARAESGSESNARPFDWARLGSQCSQLIRQWPEAFIMAGDWYRGVPERHEQRREWKVAARAAHPNPCVAEQAETCEPPLPKPGERFHVVACLHAAWNEAASDYFSRAEWERWDSLNDEDAARVVLLTALTRDADFTGWEVGLSLPWESAAGMPQDGRAMKDFGQAERYVELAKRSFERLAARWREREKLEKMKPETMRLDESLRALSGAFRNLHWFEEYAKGRERAIALHDSMRQSLAHEANRRLQQQQDANRGRNLADALSAAVDATNDLTRMANEPPAHNAPDSTIRLMQRDLQWIRWRAFRVRMLGLTGATQRLNATLKPNADGEPCSIELQKRAEQAELLHVDWMMLFQVPGKSLNAAVATLTDLSRYFGKLTGQLRAIIETEGYEAPATVGTQAIELAVAKAAEQAVKETIAGLNTRDDDKRPRRLRELKAHDRQAWQLATLHGMTQDMVAAALNEEHGTSYTQGQVSRMIARAKAHADANGLAEKVAGPIDRPRTVDPGRLEVGARVDKRKPRPSDMARANDDDE